VPLNREGKIESLHYVNGFITGSLGTFLLMAVAWKFDWHWTIYILFIYSVALWVATYHIYHRLVGELQWIARDDLRKSLTKKPVVLKERPATFTYRGGSWEHKNPKHGKRK
jgi:hypothetical protein